MVKELHPVAIRSGPAIMGGWAGRLEVREVVQAHKRSADARQKGFPTK